MKAIFIVTTMLIWSSLWTASAQQTYPIPSYSVLVTDHTVFSEQIINANYKHAKGKRNINVASSGGSQCPVQVWIFSLDKQDIFGPYIINPGETLIVAIDDREWGVLSESSCQAIMSVWIDIPEDPLGNNNQMF
jgi:hypothetical protein